MIKPVREATNKMLGSSKEMKKMLSDLVALTTEEEINFIKSLLPSDRKRIILSHNDLNMFNVLVLYATNEVILIDYKHADHNYGGIDIANILNEACFVRDLEYLSLLMMKKGV